MIRPSLNEVLECAKTLTTEKYMEYCDTIDDIETSLVNIFQKHKSNIIRLESFFWPHWVRLSDHNVFGFQEPGAYIEIYDIFAVNRITKIAWAIYVSGTLEEYEYSLNYKTFLLPNDKLKPIYEAINTVMEEKELEWEIERNNRVDSSDNSNE